VNSYLMMVCEDEQGVVLPYQSVEKNGETFRASNKMNHKLLIWPTDKEVRSWPNNCWTTIYGI
jgi:hypothetical protein